jgi:hypothetical protein
MHRDVRKSLLAILFLMSACANASDVPCKSGWLSISAQVVRIKPPSGDIRKSSGVAVHENDVLCEGDLLLIPVGVSVDLSEAGRIVTRTGEYTIRGGAAALAGKAAEYVKLAFALIEPEVPAPRPTSTSVRGSQDADTRKAAILAIAPLRDLPRQSVVRGLRPIAAWRDGTPAFRCEALNQDVEALSSSSDVTNAWCRYAPLTDDTVRLRVRGSLNRSIGWNIRVASWNDVPHPDWMEPGVQLSPQEKTAWAIWLWQHADVSWRMQSLAMLDEASQTQWLASYFIDHVLAENPPIAARGD